MSDDSVRREQATSDQLNRPNKPIIGFVSSTPLLTPDGYKPIVEPVQPVVVKNPNPVAQKPVNTPKAIAERPVAESPVVANKPASPTQGWLTWAFDILNRMKCFAAGTPILTPTGHRLIETLEVGDAL